MKTALVGYTGFVGSNIYASAGDKIKGLYNSKNIEAAYGIKSDLLIYAGLRAEKYLANKDPERDMQLILQAEENISKIDPNKLVLISTIDVFKRPVEVDEDAGIDTEGLHAYGYNRYMLECWVRDNYPDALIIRLPGLYGKNLKKNFIYDYIHVIPSALKVEKMDELCGSDKDIVNYYKLYDDGFYRVKQISALEEKELKERFRSVRFSALNFTDSRAVYQYYDLSRLWDDIQILLNNDIRLWHAAVEPVSAGELFTYLCGDTFSNEISALPAYYDYKTKYSAMFEGNDGYIADKQKVLESIKRFVELS